MKQNVAESLSEFVARIMKEKDLSAYTVAARAKKGGFAIDQSYINKIKNEFVKNPSAPKLQALACGLGEPEEIVFAIARGTAPAVPEVIKERFENMGLTFSGIPEENRDKAEAYLSLMEQEFQRLQSRK